MIYRFKNFFSDKVYQNFLNDVNNLPWFDSKILDGKYSTHFNNTLISSNTPVKKLEKKYKFIVDKINGTFNSSYYPHNMYYNCYKHGDECGIHQDRVTKEDNKTLIIYLTKEWKADWHGETLIYDDKEDEIAGGVKPYPNTAMMFDSKLKHGVSHISKFCTATRTILVLQMENIND